MHRGRRSRRLGRGFTLVESMATVVVLSVLGSVSSFLILEAVGSYIDASTSTQLHAEVSIAMDRIMRELRKIELDSSAAGIAPNITTTNPTWMNWQDSDSDLYQLLLAGSVLKLTIDGGASADLLSDVTAFSVKTFDQDNTQLGDSLSGGACDGIRRIEIEMTLERGGVSDTLRCRTFIRSTMILN